MASTPNTKEKFQGLLAYFEKFTQEPLLCVSPQDSPSSSSSSRRKSRAKSSIIHNIDKENIPNNNHSNNNTPIIKAKERRVVLETPPKASTDTEDTPQKELKERDIPILHLENVELDSSHYDSDGGMEDDFKLKKKRRQSFGSFRTPTNKRQDRRMTLGGPADCPIFVMVWK